MHCFFFPLGPRFLLLGPTSLEPCGQRLPCTQFSSVPVSVPGSGQLRPRPAAPRGPLPAPLWVLTSMGRLCPKPELKKPPQGQRGASPVGGWTPWGTRELKATCGHQRHWGASGKRK